MDDDGEFSCARHICITIEWQFDVKHCTSATDTNAIWSKIYKLSSALVIIKFEYFPLSNVSVHQLHSRCRANVFIFPFVTWSWSAINVVCMADVCMPMHFGWNKISWCRILENCFRVTTIPESSTIENTHEFAATWSTGLRSMTFRLSFTSFVVRNITHRILIKIEWVAECWVSLVDQFKQHEL